MKIPLELTTCNRCQKRNIVWIRLHDTSFVFHCSCGEDLSGYLSVDITVGYKMLIRSHYELMQNDDHLLSMVFSATALEWELVSLYKRWYEIGALEEGKEISVDEIETLLRKSNKIYDKIQRTGKVIYPQGIERFVRDSSELKNIVQQGFPSLSLDSLIKDFEKNLFWPRNRILHSAYDGYSKSDAFKSYNIAQLGLLILNTMDKSRIKSS
jgi:hypothetical protein